MKANRKWLLIPPALALLLVLGPLSMQPGNQNQGNASEGGAAAAAAPLATTTADGAAPRPSLPKQPDPWQLLTTLVGVLLCGVGGLWALRRWQRGGGAQRGGTVVTLRQSLRLSPRQTVHAVEFDDQLLLIGEGAGGLVLLQHGRLPERAADDAVLAARADALPAADGNDDDGAVPRDLVIPRPDAAPFRRPTPPSPVRAMPRPKAGLGDFRALLQKASQA